MPDLFVLSEGTSPLLINFPHSGTMLPDDIAARMTPVARQLPDTDWHVDQLYSFAAGHGATTLKATLSRYVIDLNRDPGGQSLYPGQATTGLVPTELFDGPPVYKKNPPDSEDIKTRRESYFDPYHAELSAQIARIKALHGYCVLYDAHSIASNVPRLFEGELPVLNLGTNSGQSCAPEIEQAASKAMTGQNAYKAVSNGRFKGGWITRHYGQPDHGVHALQMELAQRAYMDEATGQYDKARAARLQPVLSGILTAALDAADNLHREPV
ncbi:N-formylglutamate deformylase [Hyphobacterium sp.]|uniref:N-formylglutamate deformylase n=1 Tax=Hyphobacterium sp. TaxID=2004662 RepID=UPI003BA85C44